MTNMFHSVVSLAALFAPGLVAGAVAGGFMAHWLLHQRGAVEQPEPSPPDPRLAADINRAARAWAAAQGKPEAASLLADKLHLLHRLGSRRGWLS